MDYQVLLILAALAAISVVGWSCRLWIKQTVERSVQAKFEKELEAVRSDLRLKESKIAALQENALSGRAGRQAILDKRRIDAVENLWAATLRLDSFKPAAQLLTMLKLDVLSRRAPAEPNLR